MLEEIQKLPLADRRGGPSTHSTPMPVDPKYDVIAHHRANRRGFLLGITLAELMLITLFVLLLLLGNFQRIEDRFGGPEPLTEASSMAETIVDARPQRPLSDTWRVLTRKVEALASRPEQLDRWLDEMEKDPAPDIAQGQDEAETLREEVGDLRERLDDTKEELDRQQDQTAELQETLSNERNVLTDANIRMDLLKVELAKTKEGGLVLCMYEPPGPNASVLRGRSIPLGTVHIEADGITLIQTNETLPGMSVVDYVGDTFDTAEALSLLDGWPMHRKLNFDEFAALGTQFVSLGDRESDTRQNCRFSMNYYIEDYVTPHSVFTDVFLQYFFRQSDISQAEFEQLLPALDNSSSPSDPLGAD